MGLDHLGMVRLTPGDFATDKANRLTGRVGVKILELDCT